MNLNSAWIGSDGDSMDDSGVKGFINCSLNVMRKLLEIIA